MKDNTNNPKDNNTKGKEFIETEASEVTDEKLNNKETVSNIGNDESNNTTYNKEEPIKAEGNQNKSANEANNNNEGADKEESAKQEEYYTYNWDGHQEVAKQTQQPSQNTSNFTNDGYYHYSGEQLDQNKTYYNQNQPGGYNYNQNQYYQQENMYKQQPYSAPPQQGKPKKPKKKKGLSGGVIAIIIIVCMLVSGGLGFGGGYLAYKNFSDSKPNGAESGFNVDTDSSFIEEGSSDSDDKSSMTTAQIAEKVSSSVVEITTEVVTTGAFSQQYISSGAGSGVIVSEDGYIITNNHVIESASKITVTLKNEETYEAKLIGKDSVLDLALIKIEEKGLNPATFGDSDNLKVGEKIVAIGNPLGQLGGTVTDGIVSALSREVVIDNEPMTLLQTNAAINPGNSGGGLFDGKGRLVGIVNAKSSGSEIEGLGFAIPSNNVKEVLEDLKEHGYVRGRVYLGVSLLDITTPQMAMMQGVNEIGCYVTKVESGSSAEKAGFSVGDRIISANDTEINSATDLKGVLNKLNVGDEAKFKVARGNKEIDLNIKLEEEEHNPFVNRSNEENTQTETTTTESKERDRRSIWDYLR